MPFYIKCFQSLVNLIVSAATASEAILFSGMLAEESIIFPQKSVSGNPWIPILSSFSGKSVEIQTAPCLKHNI